MTRRVGASWLRLGRDCLACRLRERSVRESLLRRDLLMLSDTNWIRVQNHSGSSLRSRNSTPTVWLRTRRLGPVLTTSIRTPQRTCSESSLKKSPTNRLPGQSLTASWRNSTSPIPGMSRPKMTGRTRTPKVTNQPRGTSSPSSIIFPRWALPVRWFPRQTT